MFLKLEYEYSIDSYTEEEEYVAYGEIIKDQFKGIRYIKTSIPNIDKILEIIPKEKRKDFTISLMKVSGQIPPHTDSWSSTVINFYIKASESVTQFYRTKTNRPNVHQIENQTTGYMFDIKDLDPTVSFTAYSGDVYVLDVTKPHAVWSKQDPDRIAISLSTTYPFDQVINFIG